MTSAEPRTPTQVDGIAEGWVSTLVELNPAIATWIGIPGRLDEYEDLSPEGHARYIDEAKKVRASVRAATVVDEVDWVTQTDLVAEIDLAVESSEAGLWMRDVNVTESPAQSIRDVLDLMPTETESDWADIAGRLGNLPRAVDGYIASLRLGIEKGIMPAKRQVIEVMEQARRVGAGDGFFHNFTGAATLAEQEELPAALRRDLERGASVSAAAYEALATFLSDELLPAAHEDEGVGREIYGLESRRFLGTTVDLDETYEWGIDELARMTAEQEAIAQEIQPGASVAEAIAVLDADPRRKLHGTAALQEWMQQLSDTAVTELAKSHFDIPDPIRRLECRIAPTQEGGIYYTSPSDDFSRAGRMWWSVPQGVTEFDTWRETTTVYHEGVPGHHLQIAQGVYNRGTLNTYRRMLAGTSGHAEGWALYAERLMEELGYLDDPGDRFGMLDAQRMRAARVVLDIGVHLNKPRLDGSGEWDWDYALDFMGKNVNMSKEFVRFEVNRYFGWPGQAPSYKVGQRIWEQIRDSYKAAEGDAFDIREFHRKALDLGGVRLDTLRAALLK
jgi:uncharacterized protein (DUF885 family)